MTNTMRAASRVLPMQPVDSIDDYIAQGGGDGLTAARAISGDTIIDELVASGLRGRGGAGFPTGVKWRTIKSFTSSLLHTSVVINAAEGEPGTFKDRAILRANPYAVIEGALIAARVTDARTIVIAMKASFLTEIERVRSAINEIVAAGWADEVDIRIVEGPSEYLFGEETALLEVIDGRPPFPRIAPPFRHGVVELVKSEADASSGSGLSGAIQMAGKQTASAAPPVLVNNVETMANIPAIIARGAAWFRSVGTADSPGTIVCTVTGAVQHPGVGEVAMGTPLQEVIDEIGGGVLADHHVIAVLNGVSGVALTADHLGAAMSYESMAAAGTGLGSASFIVIAEDTDMVAVAAGVSRFLAVESCGQCTHCKQDGADIAALLGSLAMGTGRPDHLITLRERLATVADGARCSLATQHQLVVGNLLDTFDKQVQAHLDPATVGVPVHLICGLVNLDKNGAELDPSFADKQLDWSHGADDSGKTPAERFTDHRTEPTPEL
jgi:NADH:ubiquinone oxidoreductase subunit F (NADH-binding)